MASIEARERRRALRRIRAQRDARLRRRSRLDNAAAERLASLAARCWIHPDQLHPLHSDPRYWQARRCGWDALADELQVLPGRTRRCQPDQGPFWLWWISLHWQQRQVLMRLSAGLSAPVDAPPPDPQARQMDREIEALAAKFPDDQAKGFAALA